MKYYISQQFSYFAIRISASITLLSALPRNGTHQLQIHFPKPKCPNQQHCTEASLIKVTISQYNTCTVCHALTVEEEDGHPDVALTHTKAPQSTSVASVEAWSEWKLESNSPSDSTQYETLSWILPSGFLCYSLSVTLSFCFFLQKECYCKCYCNSVLPPQ